MGLTGRTAILQCGTRKVRHLTSAFSVNIASSFIHIGDPLKLHGLFSSLDLKLAGLAHQVRSLASLPGQGYTFLERLGLVRALRSRHPEVRFLGFRLARLNRPCFNIVLNEIFFLGEYHFQAQSQTPSILDCGANIGLATFYFKRLYPLARIQAFEADPLTASVLLRNVRQNALPGVAVHNLLLAGDEGERVFYIEDGVPGSLRMSANPERPHHPRPIVVKQGRLSQFIDGPVDLLKLDVEGCEWEVLTDLRTTRKIDHVRRMVVEYHHGTASGPSRLAGFLAQIEEEGFEYRITANGCHPFARPRVYQDILIGAYRPGSE